MPEPQEYTVGWICAIATEFVAAQAFLDERHDDQEIATNDNNSYALGSIGRHNVVIAVLPDAEYGLTSAACVARDMSHSFPNVRIGLMVGIGGGAPSSTHDVRLGDIVVGSFNGHSGGVFQYDFGETVQNQSFKERGFLNRPPTVLRTAISALKARYELEGHSLDEDISAALGRIKKRKKYARPPRSSDRLYQSNFIHDPTSSQCCGEVDNATSSYMVSRTKRDEDDDDPAIHYGVIASANQLMKNAQIRDKLAAEKGVLCFEMEAAGLMNHFPCLVIRGICDYSDSHKNKEWQGFAAMAAAAYAKDLLHQIPPSKVEAETKIGDLLSVLSQAVQEHHVITQEHRDISKEHCDISRKHRDVSEEHRDISKESLQVQKDRVKDAMTREQEKCHQQFRLTASNRDITYEWYKDRVEERVEDTCLWFLNHKHYQTWLKQESGPLLVSADPGCGKSVLAKYLIDSGLPRSTTICYFFFKDQDQNTVRQALCALLHQLFSQKPLLIEHAMEPFRKNGKHLSDSTGILWGILHAAITDPMAGSVTVVLDALDECTGSELKPLVRNIERIFGYKSSNIGKIKCLLTCRPYEQVVSEFGGLLEIFPNIRIPGEQESETISQEVNRVIQYRVNQLAVKRQLSADVKDHLEKRLQMTAHRTYLWVYLVFDYLEKEIFKRTQRGVDSAFQTLPSNVNEAYERILERSEDRPKVRKVLSVILAASRPLTLPEMNIAMNIGRESRSFDDLDLEDEKSLEERLRSLCGLFVSIHQGSVYFLHQTAREFLLADPTKDTVGFPGPQWHRSIPSQAAHGLLAELCVLFLNLYNVSSIYNPDEKSSQPFNRQAFLNYSAGDWVEHFREGDVEYAPITQIALSICIPGSRSYSVWSKIYWETPPQVEGGGFYAAPLIFTSMFGHYHVVKLLLDEEVSLEARDNYGSRTSLSWAAKNGHEAVVKLLLERGAISKAKDVHGRTPLVSAVIHGHEAVVKLLLDKGTRVKRRDSRWNQTPLSRATKKGSEAIAELLHKKGIGLETKCDEGMTPLLWAVYNKHKAIVELLLEKGARIERSNSYGQTPLSVAAENGNEAITKLLLNKGADLHTKNKEGSTPLAYAVIQGQEAIVKLLLENGAKLETKDESGKTPLAHAVEEQSRESPRRPLLENGADLETKVKYEMLLLISGTHGAVRRREAIVQLLLQKGANLETKDKEGKTPLAYAVTQQSQKAPVRLLLKNGADLESKDEERMTPLAHAVVQGHEDIVKLLIENGANLESKDGKGNTPLAHARFRGHKAIVELLLENGANSEE